MKLFINAKHLPLAVMLMILLTTSWARGQDCYLVSAGIDNYPNTNKLNGCLNDARNTAAAFKAQQGRAFGKVQAVTLLDAQATTGNISQQFQAISRYAKAGDFVVLFLSGHGARTNNNQTWFFVPYDFNPQNQAQTTLTDRSLLSMSDVLVRQGKKVVIIVDACFSGQLRVTAQAQLAGYRNPQGGGLILMLSSSKDQTSAALGAYSAFAKALSDSMNGGGDLNRDGKVTLQEIKKHSYVHTYELLRQRNLADRQDSEVAWSPSISEQTPFAATQRSAGVQPINPTTASPLPVKPTVVSGAVQVMQWTGKENLAGYGKLSFETYANGRAVMYDAQGKTEGAWDKVGQVTRLRFHNGRTIYAGIVKGSNFSGTASNGVKTWSFSVVAQPANSVTTAMIR